MLRALLLSLLCAVSFPATADGIERLVGEWQSPDGSSKQSFERAFDGAWIETRMWFCTADGWKLVSRGAMYRVPGTEAWKGIARATDMQGIVLFEFTLEADGEDGFRTRNTAYMESGESMVTEEDWRFPGTDQWTYTVYSLENGERKTWMRGEWLRAE